MGDLSFKFYEQGDSCDNVTKLSEELVLTQHKENLLKDCYKQDVFHEIDHADIRESLQLLLNYQNCVISMTGKELATQLVKEKLSTEPWYGSYYGFVAKPQIVIEPLQGIELPAKNQFIPRNFQIYSESEHERNPIPVKIDQKEDFEVYFM